MILPDFVPFPKIARLNREAIVTEKLDGTNAQVHVTDAGDIIAGSRNRWLTPENDNYGFARWVEGNKAELLKLGPGHHFGEWWGLGIQRGYGLHERRFSLFNTARWNGVEERPACCGVVLVLYTGLFEQTCPAFWIATLSGVGSYAAPGFRFPEGIVIYHKASGTLFKKLIDNDEQPKGAAK